MDRLTRSKIIDGLPSFKRIAIVFDKLIIVKYFLYADDTHLTYADNDICSIEASLKQDLSNINRWLIANKLTLNMTKTEFMLIGSRQKLNSLSAIPALETNGTQLNRANFTKSHGVLSDENLTWTPQHYEHKW